MKIVYLDSSSLGVQNLNGFKKFGNFTEYATTSPEELEERIKDVDIIITNKVIFGKKELQMAKKLKLICISATGTNNVDIPSANEMGIKVINVKDYSTESVAQMTITYMLNLSSSLIEYNNLSKSGLWAKSPIFTRLDYPFFNLKNKKLGIIGYGAIGRRVEELAKAFGMEVLISERPGSNSKTLGRVPFETILKESDFVTIHAPLTESTKNLFNKDTFMKMKKTAFLINTARGPIIDENDLYFALKEKIIKGAAIDVMTVEPPKENNPLFELSNIIITPHMAWAASESISTLHRRNRNQYSKFFRWNSN